jgi:hypothetical protein
MSYTSVDVAIKKVTLDAMLDESLWDPEDDADSSAKSLRP